MLAQTPAAQQAGRRSTGGARDQLASATAQLAQVREEKQQSEKQTEAMMASTRRRAGPRSRPITACGNRCRHQSARHRGAARRRRGAHRDSRRGSSSAAGPTCSPGAAAAWTPRAELARTYPEQIIGVEGHTESDPTGSGWARISSFRSIGPGRVPAVGHARPAQAGPVVRRRPRRQPSGRLKRHADGGERNHRLELVIYPEKYQH